METRKLPSTDSPFIPALPQVRSGVLRWAASLLPAACWHCRTFLSLSSPSRFLCPRCERLLPWVNPAQVCSRCGLPQTGTFCSACAVHPGPLDAVQAACAYEEPVRSWVVRFKYGGHDALAPLLAALLQATWRRASAETEVLIPVPLHPSRLRFRGFNQSLLLAQHLKASTLSLKPHWLQRSRPTRPQVELSGVARQQNPKQAFVARPEVAGQSIWLVDDVMTTGATLQEVARTLKAAGARKVQALVVARRFLETDLPGGEGA